MAESPDAGPATPDLESAVRAESGVESTTAEAESLASNAGSETASESADSAAFAAESAEPTTLREHVEHIVDAKTGAARLLDESLGVLAEVSAEETFDAVESADEVPYAVVLDGTLDQRVLDVAAQRGVSQVVAAEFGDFVKQPASVRIRTADQF
ncbi:hypothetical protein [Halorussus amylolyticus]|uniref:hypothetical protein n=1 Tax=Halorussus amylolyticus TaxID=1126242 RepID=UPI00138EFBCF|nr:hypothetical protein [Halorussus amylolyticus]